MPRSSQQPTTGNRQRKNREGLRVLGVDPGFGRAGVAVVERERGKDILLYSACVVTSPQEPFVKRLGAVAAVVKQLIARFKPELVALERVYFSKNQRTAMQVAEVRGALLALAAARRLPVAEFGPGEVKIAVTGAGNSGKRELIAMLPRLIAIPAAKRLDDEYDAIAIALTALASHRAARAE